MCNYKYLRKTRDFTLVIQNSYEIHNYLLFLCRAESSNIIFSFHAQILLTHNEAVIPEVSNRLFLIGISVSNCQMEYSCQTRDIYEVAWAAGRPWLQIRSTNNIV